MGTHSDVSSRTVNTQQPLRTDLTQPSRPIDAITTPFQRFFEAESSSGVLLLTFALVAIAWANSPWRESYGAVFELPVRVQLGPYGLEHSIRWWINDGLMVLFFLTVGLEIKREVIAGELASVRSALLPAGAAVGGMIVPAALYMVLNAGGTGERGWGIPMATDIAFALGVLALLRDRVPGSLRMFLAALAIVDDIGAVLVIAVAYTHDLEVGGLLAAGGCAGVLLAGNISGVRHPYFYAVAGFCLWLVVLVSGVHATVAGVVLAILVPARQLIPPAEFVSRATQLLEEVGGGAAGRAAMLSDPRSSAAIDALEEACEKVMTPLQRMEDRLSPWVTYGVMPVFALANAGVTFDAGWASLGGSTVFTGVVAGLAAGKVLGIAGATWLLVRSGLCGLPDGASWRHVVAVGFFGGIGFTMSLFIAHLALPAGLAKDAKAGTLVASAMAAAAGYLIIRTMSNDSAPRKALSQPWAE